MVEDAAGSENRLRFFIWLFRQSCPKIRSTYADSRALKRKKMRFCIMQNGPAPSMMRDAAAVLLRITPHLFGFLPNKTGSAGTILPCCACACPFDCQRTVLGFFDSSIPWTFVGKDSLFGLDTESPEQILPPDSGYLCGFLIYYE